MKYKEEKQKNRVIGVDISKKITTLAIVDIRGNIIAERSFDTSQYPASDDFVRRLCKDIITLTDENGGYESIRSIGVSVPSGSYVTGNVTDPPNLPWKGVTPLAPMLRDQLGIAVALGNDAHVAAWGEYVYGSAHGMKDFVLITIGEGVGSCFFSRGQEHLGYAGMSGEVGHTCVIDHGRRCGCGQEGCLEAYAGAQGIVNTAHELLDGSSTPSMMRHAELLTPLFIKECCDKGDELAIKVYQQTAYLLGISLANYAAIVNPQSIILTGGISHAGKWLMEPLCESFESHIMTGMRGKVKIIVSQLNNHERDVLGASVLAWQVEEYSLFK